MKVHAFLIAFAATTLALSAAAQEESALGPLMAKTTPLPKLGGIVTDMAAARRLGKAFFWDINAGSDGMACASCHFAAGADTRIDNQLSPGPTDMRWPGGHPRFGGLAFDTGGMTATAAAAMQGNQRDFSPDETAGKMPGGNLAEAGSLLRPWHFPLHQLADPDDRNSAIVFTTNDAVSSQGVLPSQFAWLTDEFGEACTPDYDSAFLVTTADGQLRVRAVEPRNTPTTINAGFAHRTFWDGRANHRFNGFDPFGNRSPAAMVLRFNVKTGNVATRKLNLTNAALASQAVGPPLSHLEMSCGGKTFPMLGRKMLGLQALANQAVHSDDSLLAAFATSKPYYKDLIKQAFHSSWWSAPENVKYTRKGGSIKTDPNGFTQMELNFTMFWGIAIMLYESTLVSNQTPFDKSFGGKGPHPLNAQELKGLEVFTGKGQCIACHDGPLFTKSAIAEVEHMLMGDDNTAFYDNAFYNIGVNYTVTDIGLGGADPWGRPLAFSRQLLLNKTTDVFNNVNLCELEVIPFPFDPALGCDPAAQLEQLRANAAEQRVAVDGAFKVPTLRNVGLTPPYLHNGSAATLMQVVEFYDRGGNRRGNDTDDTSGTGPLGRPFGTGDPVAAYRSGSNLDPDINRLELSEDEKADLVAFMLALTDERVRCDKAPFDHPALPIPVQGGTGIEFLLPAVGKDGLPHIGRTCRPNSGDLFGEFQHLEEFKP